MSQQNSDDLARALDGLGQSKPAPSPAAQPRPAPKTPQIKIQTAPAKAPVPAARPAQPGANPAPAGKGIPMPRQVNRPAAVPAAKVSRASSPLDAPASLASAVKAKTAAAKPSRKPAARGNVLAQTMIPILLTLGFILVALCVIHFKWKSIDNPTSDVSPKMAYGIGGLGIVIWGLAAIVMASVARQLRAASAQPALGDAKPVSRAARPD